MPLLLLLSNRVTQTRAWSAFSCAGFGARFPNGQVSHCFNLNGQAAPECNGIPDVLHFYQQAVLNLQLYGPTNVRARVVSGFGTGSFGWLCLVLMVVFGMSIDGS